jgi:hypothetical protein
MRVMHCWWECKLVQPLCKRIWRLLKKLKIDLPYNPAIPLLGIYLKECDCTPISLQHYSQKLCHENNQDALQLANGLRKCRIYT